MASDFILQIICRIHQIWNPKRPLFRVKSQKNDTIGSATLNAPEIISGIKPGMYGSLFSTRMRRYCLENLHYCIFFTTFVNATMNVSVKRALLIHRFSLVSPLVAIKSRGEALSRSTEV